MMKWLMMAGSVAVAFGLVRASRRSRDTTTQGAPGLKITTFHLRCQSCGQTLVVDTGRHFADPNDSEAIDALVRCTHCQGEHKVAYSPMGAVHKSILIVPPVDLPLQHRLWNAAFSGN
jgi:ribosomal protein S27E